MRVIFLIATIFGVVACFGSNNVMEWFNVRDTDLYLCGESSRGLYMKYPVLPNCIPPKVTTNSTIVFLTSYWKDHQQYMVKGQECYKKSFTNYVTSSWLGLKRKLLLVQNEKHLKLSRDECLEMIKSGKTQEDETLQVLGNGLLGTKNNNVPEGSWYGHQELDNTNYYVQDVWFNVNEDTEDIEPVGTSIPFKCKVNAEICPTVRGVLVWKREEHKMCRLLIGKTTACLRTDEHITCPETLTSINGWSTTKICGETVALSKSRVMFSTNVSGELHKDVYSHETIVQDMQAKYSNRIDIGNQTDSGVISTTQFGMHYDHINRMVTDTIAAVISTFHYTDCKQNRLQLEMHLREAEKGNVQGLLTGLFQDPTIRGENAGDLVSVWRCKRINIYRFVDNEECSLEQPVKYLDGGEEKDGWITSIWHDIVKAPTLVPCPSQPYHFLTSQGIVFHLEKKIVVEGIETMPNPAAAIRPETNAIHGFVPEAVFQDSSRTKRTMTQAEALNNVFVLGQILDDLKHGEIPTGKNEWEIVNVLGDLITSLILFPSTIWGFLKYAIIVVVVSAVAYILTLLRVFPIIIKLHLFGARVWIRVFRNIFKAVCSLGTGVGKAVHNVGRNGNQYFPPTAPTAPTEEFVNVRPPLPGFIYPNVRD